MGDFGMLFWVLPTEYLKFRSQNSGVRIQKSEFRSQNSEVRSQNSGVRIQESEFRSQNSEVRIQESKFKNTPIFIANFQKCGVHKLSLLTRDEKFFTSDY